MANPDSRGLRPILSGLGPGSRREAREARETVGIRLIQSRLYRCRMLTLATRLDVMNRLGRAMADPTRSRILMSLLDGPAYPAALAEGLHLTRQNVSNHLACLRDCGIVAAASEGRQTRYEISDPHLARALTDIVDVVLAVDDSAECIDAACAIPGCCDRVR